jgi:predicted PurR-regulated permease PerM
MQRIRSEVRQRMVANILTGCAVVLFAVVAYRINDIMRGLAGLMSILSPLIVGFIIALVLRPALRWVEKLMCLLPPGGKPTRRRLTVYRAVSLVIVYTLLVALVVGLFVIVVPQFVISAQSLTGTVSGYVTSHRGDIEWFLREFNITDMTGQSSQNVLLQWEDIVRTAMDYLGKLLLSLLNMSYSLWGVSVNLIMATVISIYMLFGREKFLAQGKKISCAFLNPKQVCVLAYWLKRANTIFTGFISGKLIETVVVGIACYIGMLIFKMDYALLISVIVGVTNFIPFIGALMGAVIGIVILLMVNPVSAFWFLIFIVVLQQLDGNVFGPRILGDSLGISSFWVILAILLGGGLFGVTGMILFIPVFAVLYEMISALVRQRLKARGMPHETQAYDVPGLPEGVCPVPGENSANKPACDGTEEENQK